MSKRFNVFNAVMDAAARDRRARTAASADTTPVEPTSKSSPTTVVERGTEQALPGAAMKLGAYTSPFLSRDSIFIEGPEGGVTRVGYGDIDKTLGANVLTPGEAALASPTGKYGPTVGTPLEGTFAETMINNVLGAITPMGLGSLSYGETVAGVADRKNVAIPGGIYGFVAGQNVKNQYDVAQKIRAGTPGFHQFYSGGQLVSITPQTIMGKHMGFAATGTGASQQSLNQYAALYGYDPRTANFFSDPSSKNFGVELEGFIPGSGGFSPEDGSYVDVNGNVMSSPRDLEAHMGLVAEVYGPEVAIDLLSSNENIGPSVRDSMMSAIQSGELSAKAYRDADGNVVGYGTGSGGYVTNKEGEPINKGNAYFGTGALSKDAFNAVMAEAQAQRAEAEASDSGYGMGKGTLQSDGYGQVSGRDGPVSSSGQAASERGDTFFGGSDYDPGFDDGDTGDTGGTDQASADEAGGSSMSSPFAEGGFVNRTPMQEGGEAPVVQDAGFVGEEPESLPEGMTVADDVPIDVPEGTFVLNAAAVEFMGSADVKKMILQAIAEAERQGVDITQRDDTIPKEDLVSLVVSRGEVIIPPELAKIIGYDRLNKINNRGKAEVQKRIDENGQAEPTPEKPEVLQQAALGGTQVSPEEAEGFAGKPSPAYEQEQLNLSALEAVEGMSYEAYVPKGGSKSGVTIGRGVDLAYHSEDDFKRAGVSDDVIEVLRPFMATGQGKYGPRGDKAKKALQDVPLTAEQIETFSTQIYNKKWSDFQRKYPEYTKVNPKDTAVLFTHYYVKDDDAFGNEERKVKPMYKTFMDVYQETGDIFKATEKGLFDKIPEGDAEYNRAFNVMNWYLTSDDQELINKTPGQQAAYTRSMLEAFSRRDELENAPAGFIPPASKSI